MIRHSLLVALLAVAISPGAGTAAEAPTRPMSFDAVESYARDQGTTGLLVVQNGVIRVEKNWPLPAGSGAFSAVMTYGPAPDGALMEDVASQQKSFVSALAGIAVDRKLLDVERPVTWYVGAGWSKATPEQESAIKVLNLLQMNSGLNDDLTYAAPPGDRFRYNTPAYAVTLRVLEAAAKQPLATLTRDWLAGPLGMNSTRWRQRPAMLAAAGNGLGLVTTPRDEAKFGRMILARGLGPDGRRVISPAQLQAMFDRSTTNPAYGRLWWLNGSAFTIGVLGERRDGPLIPAAPADLVAALGLYDRKLYLVPSAGLIVVRFGVKAADKDFDQQLWTRLSSALALDARQ
jgi:CubicO group peptidase (beta-lactamase class C family)